MTVGAPKLPLFTPDQYLAAGAAQPNVGDVLAWQVGGAAFGPAPIGTTLTTSAPGGTTALVCDGATHTFLTSPSLAVGTWLVTASALIESTVSGSIFVDMGIAVGSATASFVGPVATGLGFPGATFQFCSMPAAVQAIATVTVAGTLIFRYNATNGASAVFQGTGITTNLGVSSGITAVRLF